MRNDEALQWFSTLALHWNHLGSFEKYWCLSIILRAPDLIGGCSLGVRIFLKAPEEILSCSPRWNHCPKAEGGYRREWVQGCLGHAISRTWWLTTNWNWWKGGCLGRILDFWLGPGWKREASFEKKITNYVLDRLSLKCLWGFEWRCSIDISLIDLRCPSEEQEIPLVFKMTGKGISRNYDRVQDHSHSAQTLYSKLPSKTMPHQFWNVVQHVDIFTGRIILWMGTIP